MSRSSLKPKGFRGTKGHSQGGQLSRVSKPAGKSGKTSGKGFPGSEVMPEYLISKEYDPETGFTDEMFYDDQDKKIHVRRTQDVEYNLKQNEIIKNHSRSDFYRDDGLYLKARIPNAYIEKWLLEDGFNWFRSSDADRRKKLNQHPELHVRKGRV